MKILAISDVGTWSGYEEIVDRTRPDVVALAGDLTSDGFASFWRDALEAIPAFRRQHKLLRKRYGINGFKSLELWDQYDRELAALKLRYRRTQAFKRNRKRMHVDKFYRFLKYAGKRFQVLVLKGDHDDDFEGDYVPEEIEAIPGCAEISSKAIDIGGFRFLGVAPQQMDSHKRVGHISRTFGETVDRYRGRVDIVIAHCQFGRTRLLAHLNPKLIIRGHSALGKYMVEGVPAVFTAGARHAVITLSRKSGPSVALYQVGPDGAPQEVKQQKLWFYEFEQYPWLKRWKPLVAGATRLSDKK